MARLRERYVSVSEFSVRVSGHPDYPAEMTVRTFQKVEASLRTAQSEDRLFRETLEENRLFINLDDMLVNVARKYAALLFTIVDADAADAVYRNLKSNKPRLVAKGPDEGGAASAHFVIDLDSAPNIFRYKSGLEDIEGVSRSRILPFLEQLMRDICGEVTTVIDDEKVRGLAKLELQALHQGKIADAAGRPVRVELVDIRPRHTLDQIGGDGYRETARVVDFSISRKGPDSAARKAMLAIRTRQKNEEDLREYPLMRVRWLRPDNRQQTVSVDAFADDLLERAFTRLEVIDGFEADLPLATNVIRADVVSRIIKMLRS